MIADLALVVGLYCTWRALQALRVELVAERRNPLSLAATIVLCGVFVWLTLDIAVAGSGWAQAELGR